VAHRFPHVLIHCVFSTKERRNLIPDDLLPKLWKYFVGIGRNHGVTVLAQAEHHAKRSYESEFEAILRKSGMEFDLTDAFG
jgi:hypothetical protein